jgi:hypothetical protein
MSRKIHLDDDCTLRFPGRSEDFADGVEVGILAAQMDLGIAPLVRRVGVDNIEQVRVIASRLGYRLTIAETDEEAVTINLQREGARPRLRLVHRA